MADVLDQLSSVIGRPVKPLERAQKPASEAPQRNEFMAADNPKGLVSPGNLPIWNRPTVQNSDGSHSSEYSTSFQDEHGREVLVPTIVNGKFLTPDGKMPKPGSKEDKAMKKAAWDHYLKTKENLGIFDNPDNADAYAGVLHSRGEKGAGSEDEAKNATPPSLESVIGRKLQPAKLDPVVASRFKTYSTAMKNGFSPDVAAKTAMASGVVQADPSTWRKVTSSIRNAPTGTGQTFGQVGEATADVLHRAWSNPMGISDERWEKAQKEVGDYLRSIDVAHLGDGAVGKLAAGADIGAFKFAGESASPGQIALLVGTFGESALVRAGVKLGIEGAPAVARTLSKLMQVQFGAQMVEGTAEGAENTYKSAIRGDWEAAGENAIGGLISGIMAKGLASHEVAQEKVRGDLETTARERFGPPIGNPVTAAITSRFNQLDPYHQGLIIHDAVSKFPEYQEIVAKTEAQNQKERAKHEQRKTDYHDLAISQAWEPDAAKRGFDSVDTGRRRDAAQKYADGKESSRQHYIKQVVETLKEATKRGSAIEAARLEDENQAREEGREERPAIKAQKREQKAVTLTNAKQVTEARSSAAETRRKANEAQEERTASVQRPVDAQVDQFGHASYRSNYWGEENTFGVAGDADNLGVYRQTPRGMEYLDKSGFYTDQPQEVYLAPDHATADTLAKISSLRHAAESESNGAEESLLSGIEQKITSGEMSAADARKELGIKEEIELPTEVDALRAGNLKGPLAERSEGEYYDELMNQAQDAGFSPEETEAMLQQAGVLARAETENNLHHVAQSGDYVTSKKGVRWTLDSRGMLHPDDGGAAVPLMKNGHYTGQSLTLARSGRVGYAGRTREMRRADTARQRSIQAMIDTIKPEISAAIDHVLLVAQQNQGLELAPENLPSETEPAKKERAKGFKIPDPSTAQARESATGIAALIREGLEKSGAAEVVDAIAKENGVDAEEVLRQKLAKDDSPAGKAASLQVGDKVTDPFRKDRPWVVERAKSGGLQLRSGNANPLPLDRLNPSERVLGLLRNGGLDQERPITDQDVTHVAFESPHVIYREEQVEKVRAIRNGTDKVPEPKTPAQAKAQATAAEHRTDAAVSKATETQAEALEPPPGTTGQEAENKVDEAEEAIKTAEEAYSQEAKAVSQTVPKDAFPPRAPVTVGLRGSSGVIKQNGREIPMHYEMVPLESLLTSHAWQDNMLVENEGYPSELQPRTISESESKENALRAQDRYTDENGVSTGYDFSEYADKTINGAMGPALIEPGGRVVGGNTRLAIMRKRLQNLSEIQDPIEREVNISLFRDGMRQLARDTGILPPLDDIDYAVVRMLDKPIETLREAADLGRLFNKSISVQMTDAAKGVSYSKSLTAENLSALGRLVEEHDGLTPAIKANPEYFSNLVRNNFGIVSSEFANWFESDKSKGLVLNDAGQSQLSKALLGTIFRDTSILSRIEDSPAYRSLERALPYLIKMRSIPDRNISGKVMEAVTAAADTRHTEPGLSLSQDKWAATYRPDQVEFLGMEEERPPEPDRMVETIWRALTGGPRTFNDRLKNWIGEESAANESMFAVHETPAEVFSNVFRKELKESSYSHGEKGEPTISQAEFDSLMRNQDLSEEGREEAKRADEGKPPKVEKTEVKAKPKGFTPPPIAAEKPASPEAKIAEAKEEKGYVTSEELKSFLSSHPSTKDHVNEVMRIARMMAEYVFEADPPEGVERQGALDWVLKDRVSKLDQGKGKGRGSYSDPLVEKGIGTGILKLTNAADETTFIHEFAHVIFPMLSEDDHRNINTILHEKIPQWDHNTPLKGESYKGLSEKFAGALEKFLRDQNPRGFSAEVKLVLAKVKEMFRKAYLRFRGDPLSDFKLTDEAKGIFTDMFHIEDLDISDSWHDEVKKARAESKRLTRPEDEPHPIQKIARDTGATGIRQTFAGKVEDTIGDRVDPKKSTAVLVFPNQETANTAWLDAGTENSKIQNAELIAAEDGSYGIRINTASKVPTDVLYQEVPRKHPGIELEETKKRLAATPASAPMVRRLLELKVQNLENEIRSKYGVEERKPAENKQAAQEALKEKKNASSGKQAVSDVRRLPEGSAGDLGRGGARQIPEFALLARKDDAALRSAGGPLPGTRSLTGAKPVSLEPLAGRGEPVGILHGQKFNASEWVSGNRKAGLPENAPPPTVAISAETAAQLKYAGQKQIVQLAMSALEQGDGFVVASATGSGKTYTGAAIAKEFLNASPGAKVLYITKNRGLLDRGDKSFKSVAKNTFGVDVEGDVPRGTISKGVYGTTYQRLLGNEIYKNTDWDLVLADESGEMRNWFREENQQGKAGIDVIDKSKKAVYISATPFHSPAEYGYVKKLNLWPKNGFDKWISENFAHEKIGDKVVAKLDPGKQAKLRQQLIERGQFVSQMISYEGFTTHFGVVPVTDETRRALNRIHEGVSRAKSNLVATGKKGLADRLSAFEATYTKAFLERSRLPQAIELTRKGLDQGWHPLVFSETTSEDLFRRPEDGEPGTYRKLDQEMGGELSRIIPPFANVFDELKKAFGERISDFSGMDNTDAAREEAKREYLEGRVPALYTTYAAGGIGVSLHDEDGDKPRLAIFLGPPYSGVLLEQAMGRPWRFGVKSNVLSVFLATDSEPDIQLMATKVGPRMRAVRASVLGERDSLGAVMGNYSSEEKTREQQDMLAYDQGNEVKVDAQSFQRRDKRNVNIDNWSAINIPHADTAKHKGMQVKTAGKDGDWATMYQSKNRFARPPMSIGDMAAQRKVNDVAEAIAKGTGLSPGDPALSMDPSERETAAGASAAVGAQAIDIPVQRDKGNAGKMAAENMYRRGWEQDVNDGVWKANITIERRSDDKEPASADENIKTDWGLVKAWAMSSETAIRSIASQAGTPEAGLELVRMQRNYVQMIEKHYADYANEFGRIAMDRKIDYADEKTMREIFDVVEGKSVSKDENINKAGQEIADLMEIIHGDMASADVKVTNRDGEALSYKNFPSDRNHMPHRIDWDAKIEDPNTKDVKTLKEIMGKTFDKVKRERMLRGMADQMGKSPAEVADILNKRKATPPVFGNVQRTREIDFPIYKKDLQTMMRYFEQAAGAIAREKVFGGEKLSKLNSAVAKIPSENGRTTIHDLFAQNWRNQDWSTSYGKLYNRIAAIEIFTKMNWSAIKVPFHLANVPLALGGRPMPVIKAMFDSVFNRAEFKENTAMAGTIVRQVNPLLLMEEDAASGVAHWILKKEGFEAAYRWGRAIAGASARIYMDQYALDALKRGGADAGEARRILKDRMLVSDTEIDRAIAKGQFSHEATQTAQRAFTNLTMFSERNPLQMPLLARLDTSERMNSGTANLNRAVRMTYLLQSFAVKFHSLAKETVYDEVVKHKNYKPLAYLAVTAPVLGQLLKGAAAAIPSGVHRGAEQATGQQHKQDSWDRYLNQLKGLYGDHPAIAAMKIYIDGMCAQTALDMLRTVMDPVLDILGGEKKKAGTELEYLKNDLEEGVYGPGWTSMVVNMLDLMTAELKSSTSKDPVTKEQKAFMRWLENEVPSLKLVPGMETQTKKPASSGGLSAPPF